MAFDPQGKAGASGNDDLYEVLGLAPTASADDIDAAYHRLVNGLTTSTAGSAEAVDRLRRRRLRLANAYAVLGDPEQREAYDTRWGLSAGSGAAPPMEEAVPAPVRMPSIAPPGAIPPPAPMPAVAPPGEIPPPMPMPPVTVHAAPPVDVTPPDTAPVLAAPEPVAAPLLPVEQAAPLAADVPDAAPAPEVDLPGEAAPTAPLMPADETPEETYPAVADEDEETYSSAADDEDAEDEDDLELQAAAAEDEPAPWESPSPSPPAPRLRPRPPVPADRRASTPALDRRASTPAARRPAAVAPAPAPVGRAGGINLPSRKVAEATPLPTVRSRYAVEEAPAPTWEEEEDARYAPQRPVVEPAPVRVRPVRQAPVRKKKSNKNNRMQVLFYGLMALTLVVGAFASIGVPLTQVIDSGQASSSTPIPQSTMDQADAALAAGNYALAITLYNEVRTGTLTNPTQDPDNPHVLLGLAKAYYMKTPSEPDVARQYIGNFFTANGSNNNSPDAQAALQLLGQLGAPAGSPAPAGTAAPGSTTPAGTAAPGSTTPAGTAPASTAAPAATTVPGSAGAPAPSTNPPVNSAPGGTTAPGTTPGLPTAVK